MRGKYKNKKLKKDDSSCELNTAQSYVEIPVAEYVKKGTVRSVVKSSIVSAVVFALILCVGIFVIVRGATPRLFVDKSFVPTQATLVKYEWRYVRLPGYTKGWTPYPVFNYVYDGEEYTIEHNVTSFPTPIDEGSVVTIYVNPNDPTDIVSPIADKPLIIFGLAVILFAFFAFCIISLRPILEAAYPSAHWPKFLTAYFPSMVFMWSLVAILCYRINRRGAATIALAIALALLATFISTIMLRDMINTFRKYRERKAEEKKEN